MRIKKASLVLTILLLVSWLAFSGTPSRFDSIRRLAHAAYAELINEKEQIIYNGPVKATPKGKVAVGVSLHYLQPESDLVLFLGKVIVNGKITPLTPGIAIPTKLQLLCQHKSPTGQILKSFTFTLNVQSNGQILLQNFPYTIFDVIGPQHFLVLQVIPFSGNLPAGNLNLNVTHLVGSGASIEQAIPPEDASNIAAAPILVFNFVEFYGGLAKGKPKGPIGYKSLTANGFPFTGLMQINGKITRDNPQAPLPKTLRFIVQHKDPVNNKLISTSTVDIKVQSTGMILSQSFPFTSPLAQGKPENFLITFRPFDGALPSGVISIRFALVPVPPPV
jgi:hypothetical protein